MATMRNILKMTTPRTGSLLDTIDALSDVHAVMKDSYLRLFDAMVDSVALSRMKEGETLQFIVTNSGSHYTSDIKQRNTIYNLYPDTITLFVTCIHEGTYPEYSYHASALRGEYDVEDMEE